MQGGDSCHCGSFYGKHGVCRAVTAVIAARSTVTWCVQGGDSCHCGSFYGKHGVCRAVTAVIEARSTLNMVCAGR